MKVKDHYERAAKRRSTRLMSDIYDPAWKNHNRRLYHLDKIFRHYCKQKKVIDLGCGTGIWSHIVADYSKSVTGVDFALNNIKISKTLAKEKGLTNVKFVVADIGNIKNFVSQKYGVIICISVLQHLHDKELFLKSLNPFLEKEGVIILLVHNKDCFFNYREYRAKKNNSEIEINDYLFFSDLEKIINKSGLTISNARFTWSCFEDIFYLLGENKIGVVIRNYLHKISMSIELLIGRYRIFRFFFRESILIIRRT
jgi:ubiquinone/menaquinone biosynthesis C-methylase UbiE